MITDDNEDMSDIGNRGWELVSVVKQTNKVKLYFKRPVKSLRDRITSEQRKAVYKKALEGAE